MPTPRRRLKWAIGGTSLALAVSGGAVLASDPAAHAAVTPGQGSSYAQGLQVAPHDGSLAVGVTLAEALAGHTNDVARAQSQGIDLGAIGTSLTGYNCGSQAFKPNQIPQALETETGDQGAAQGQSQQLDPSSGTSQPSFGTDEFVKATSAPYGEADTSLPPLSTPVFRVDDMATKAWSGLVNGQRIAGATATIGGVDIANGLVDLTNLKWDSQYPSGGSAKPSGTFTLGGVKIHGVALPTGKSLTAVQDALNKVLGTIGLELDLPVSSVSQGVQTVSPLEIQVVPNDTRDNIVNAGLNATEQEQQTLFGGLEDGFSPSEPSQLVQALCQSDTPITVASVALASINGAGFFSAALGGVNSSSSNVAANPYSLGGFSGSLGLGGNQLGGASLDSGGATVPAIAGTGASPVAGGGSSGASPGASVAAAPPTSPSGSSSSPSRSGGSAPASITPASVSYAAGGPLLAIGLAGLGLLALLAEADRRMMRRAQHTVQFEE